ncbi:MAG: acyl-CoA dehydrogenase family protein [Oceanococcaceae bacterium]
MQFTPEHEELRRTVARFVDVELNPNIDEWERAGIWPAREVLKKAADLGLLGISKPEAYGGLGLDYSYSLVYAEELGNCSSGALPMAIGVVTDMATPALARFGSVELCDEFLRPTIAGDRVCSIGVSEPGAGSDVANIRTEARKDQDDYVISGSKMWITNGTQADWICLLCNTSDGSRHSNKSLIIVPMDAPGVQVEKKLDKLGMRASDTAIIHFDKVRVPQRYRIGQEGAGFMYQMLQFQEERLFGAMSAVRGMELAINQTIDYCRQRQTFGQPLINNQVIHFRLAELQTEVECLRALCYQSCEDYVAGRDAVKGCSMAKLKAGRLAREVADSCLQYWGGMGYVNETEITRNFRDSRLLSIGGGADEIMLGIICKLMGTLPGKAKT